MRSLPKNICQMGERDARLRIYLEDEVNVFLKKSAMAKTSAIGVFLGEKRIVEGEHCLFVRGAVFLGECEDEIRTSPEQAAEAWFSGEAVVGWFINQENDEVPDLYQCQKQKRKLAMAKETLFCVNSREERHFYWMTGEVCRPLLGYYIYYVTNHNMQAYLSAMAFKEPGPVEEGLSDRTYKCEERVMKERARSGRLAYGLCAILTLVLAFSGAFILQKKARPGLVTGTEAEVEVNVQESLESVIVQEIQGGVEPTQTESETETLPNP